MTRCQKPHSQIWGIDQLNMVQLPASYIRLIAPVPKQTSDTKHVKKTDWLHCTACSNTQQARRLSSFVTKIYAAVSHTDHSRDYASGLYQCVPAHRRRSESSSHLIPPVSNETYALVQGKNTRERSWVMTSIWPWASASEVRWKT